MTDITTLSTETLRDMLAMLERGFQRVPAHQISPGAREARAHLIAELQRRETASA